MISAGFSMNQRQIPGFNNFKVNASTFKPNSLIATYLDITKAYGQVDPDWKTLPVYTLDFEKEYGFTDITAETINERMNAF